MIKFDKDDRWLLLMCLIRYSLGRRSYIVGTATRIIEQNWEGLEKHEKKQVKREIEEYIRFAKDCDYITDRHWEKILEMK